MTQTAYNTREINPVRPPFRQVDAAKLRAKRLSCKTCDGKVCVGRCRFEKVQ